MQILYTTADAVCIINNLGWPRSTTVSHSRPSNCYQMCISNCPYPPVQICHIGATANHWLTENPNPDVEQDWIGNETQLSTPNCADGQRLYCVFGEVYALAF